MNRNDSPTNRKPAAQFTVFDEKSFVDFASGRVNNSSVGLLLCFSGRFVTSNHAEIEHPWQQARQ